MRFSIGFICGGIGAFSLFYLVNMAVVWSSVKGDTPVTLGRIVMITALSFLLMVYGCRQMSKGMR